jgi:predicted DNA-binding mobile mystery protein A
MKVSQKRVLIEQLDRRLERFGRAADVEVPSRGWIHAIRTSLRMSMRQLGRRLGIRAQSVFDIERAEASGSISIKSLQEVAKALNLKFVYGFVSKEHSIEKMIEKRALEKAREIVLRTPQSEEFEDEENRQERIDKAIEDNAYEIKRELPRFLWD